MAPYIVFRCNTCNKILSSVRTFKDHNKRFHNNDEDYELVDKVSGENVYKKKAPMVDIQESGKSKPKFVPPLLQTAMSTVTEDIETPFFL